MANWNVGSPSLASAPSEMTQFLENPALQPVYESAIMMMSERKEPMYMFIEELANEDVAAVINDTNRGRTVN